jgi:hypothetical protein
MTDRIEGIRHATRHGESARRLGAVRPGGALGDVTAETRNGEGGPRYGGTDWGATGRGAGIEVGVGVGVGI